MADDCIIWDKALNNGYGRQWNPRTKRVDYAHRIAWEHAVGPIPKGFEVHHVCETRPCINPEHLECVHPKAHRVLHGWQAEAAHGSYSRYVLGCRCTDCRRANREYKRQWEATRA